MPYPYSKQMIALGLSLVMAMGVGTSAFAKGNDKFDNRSNNRFDNRSDNRFDSRNFFNGKKTTTQYKVNINFKDMQNGQGWDWALRYIADLASRNVFNGYEDGTFRPQATVTRIEAITAAVRLMGLESQAQSSSEMSASLNFADAKQVPSWAVGYVSVALKNDLFGENDNNVNPNQPADRLWATTLLVKALKLTSQAEAKMNQKLSFADANKIPAGSVGFVAVAVEQGLVNGFEDNTFRPNQSVTRAQIAALLDRAGDKLSDSEDGLLVGTVNSPVSGNVLTITTTSGQTANLALDPNAFIYRNNTRITASQLQTGDIIKSRTVNGSTIFVEVTQLSGGSTPTTTPITSYNGLLSGTLSSVVNGYTVTLTSGNQTYSLPLNSSALIYRYGTNVGASSLQAGDIINLRAYNNTVVFIDVTQPYGAGTQPNYEASFTGKLASPVSNNVMVLNTGSETKTFAYNTGAFIYRNGVQVNASSLQAGDSITVYTVNNTIAVAEVTANASGPVTTATNGSDIIVNATLASTVNGNTVTIQNGSSTQSYPLQANAFIYRSGALTNAASLLAGDAVVLHVKDNIVWSVEAATVSGQLTVTSGSGTIASAISNNVLVLNNNGQTTTYTVDANAVIYRNGVQTNLSTLQAGDIVVVRSYANNALYIEVTQASSSNNTSAYTINGTLSGVNLNNQGVLSTVSVTQTNSDGTVSTNVYNVSPSVTINGSLVVGHSVVLVNVNSLITSITVN